MTDNLELPLQIPAREISFDGPKIRRLLPWSKKRMVGPFIFLDHFPSTHFPAGKGFNVRPHPHIGLSTLSYLYEGAVLHHDSLDYEQILRPGDVNWMTAGSGIAHSERTPEELRDREYNLHLLQFWVALPQSEERRPPSFEHHPADSIPHLQFKDGDIRVVVGEFGGIRSPVKAYSTLHFVDVKLKAQGECPLSVTGSESAFYLLAGEGVLQDPKGPREVKAGDCFIVNEGATLLTTSDCHFVLFGGQAFPEERHIEWNFVSSRPEWIESAKQAWRDRSFPQVPREVDFIPLPGEG